ncbi:hypothetical protein CDAR_213351 [Caerostris darwini]|uniref:Uncharacterized protein n=1 Tax=Caerostris darwini TaxID=1538125 RepID=A0AAV4PYR7_9ARAC|nr:hypothetical protein CDAR_213351 [Caerostris darwini]
MPRGPLHKRMEIREGCFKGGERNVKTGEKRDLKTRFFHATPHLQLSAAGLPLIQLFVPLCSRLPTDWTAALILTTQRNEQKNTLCEFKVAKR